MCFWPDDHYWYDTFMNNENFFSKEGWPARLTPFSMVSSTLGDLVLISLMINLLGLALPLTLLQVYDRILQFQAVSTLSWLLIGVITAIFLESAGERYHSHASVIDGYGLVIAIIFPSWPDHRTADSVVNSA